MQNVLSFCEPCPFLNSTLNPGQCAHILICHGAKSIFVTCVVFSDFPRGGVQIVIKDRHVCTKVMSFLKCWNKV